MCVYVYVYVCLCECMFVYVCVLVCMYGYVCACMVVCVGSIQLLQIFQFLTHWPFSHLLPLCS